MTDWNSEETQVLEPPIERPVSVTVFGILNIIFSCYFLVRMIYCWQGVIAGIFMSPEKIIYSRVTISMLLFFVSIGMLIWLIVLGIGLLTMKKWARRGSLMYARIVIILMIITLGGIIIPSITRWENPSRILMGTITLNNAIAVIWWIYMILLLIFMKSPKVKDAFAAVGG